TDLRRAIIQLVLFVFVAGLICWFNYLLRSFQDGLRRSEQKFRALVANAPFGICRCNAQGIVLEANPALVAMLGYGSPANLEGDNLANIYADSQHWFTLADYLRSLQPFTGLTTEWTRKDGKQVVVRLSGRAYQENGNAIFFELFAEDITQHHAL